MDCDQVRAALAAYVLHAAEEGEAEVVEAHVHRCPGCRAELRAHRATATVLAALWPAVEPPPRLRERLLALAHGDVVREPRRRRDRTWALLRRLARGPAASLTVGALALLAALVWAGEIWGQAQALERERVAQAALSLQIDLAITTLANPLVAERALQAPGRPGTVGRLYLRPDGRPALLVAVALPPLAANESYRVWLRHATGWSHVTTFEVAESGNAVVRLSTRLAAAEIEAAVVSAESQPPGNGPSGRRVLESLPAAPAEGSQPEGARS